jgi:hypothetical protein
MHEWFEAGYFPTNLSVRKGVNSDYMELALLLSKMAEHDPSATSPFVMKEDSRRNSSASYSAGPSPLLVSPGLNLNKSGETNIANNQPTHTMLAQQESPTLTGLPKHSLLEKIQKTQNSTLSEQKQLNQSGSSSLSDDDLLNDRFGLNEPISKPITKPEEKKMTVIGASPSLNTNINQQQQQQQHSSSQSNTPGLRTSTSTMPLQNNQQNQNSNTPSLRSSSSSLPIMGPSLLESLQQNTNQQQQLPQRISAAGAWSQWANPPISQQQQTQPQQKDREQNQNQNQLHPPQFQVGGHSPPPPYSSQLNSTHVCFIF